MQVQVIYFAALRDLARLSEEAVVVSENSDVQSLLRQLCERHVELRLDGVRVAVNEEFVEISERLHDGDIVALIPPVSGG